jgi:hypothetical protein
MGIFVVWRSTTVRAGVGEWEREKRLMIVRGCHPCSFRWKHAWMVYARCEKGGNDYSFSLCVNLTVSRDVFCEL